MANASMKNKKNINNTWYYTNPNDDNGKKCIACNICYTSTPNFFAKNEDGNAYVCKQPESDEDKELCQDNLDTCPIGSIGNED